jgi:hypothetical protein
MDFGVNQPGNFLSGMVQVESQRIFPLNELGTRRIDVLLAEKIYGKPFSVFFKYQSDLLLRTIDQ